VFGVYLFIGEVVVGLSMDSNKDNLARYPNKGDTSFLSG